MGCTAALKVENWVRPYNRPMASGRPDHERALSATLDLFDVGVTLMRQNLRRLHPEASEVEIDRRLQEWLRERPGAEAGDAVGRHVDPRTRFA